VWSINRLLRNPVDQGTIQWLLQRRQLLSIQTMEKEHTPEDNVLILNVESGVANQFIIDLTKGTLRGLNSKLEKDGFRIALWKATSTIPARNRDCATL